MADWTTIADTQVDPNAPVTSELMTALRDNPIAISEGSAGAPKINPITAFAHGGNVGQVGTYAFLSYPVIIGVPVQDISGEGNLVAGSSLRYSGAYPTANGSAPVGTWRCMGRTTTVRTGDNSPGNPYVYYYYGTVFLRVA